MLQETALEIPNLSFLWLELTNQCNLQCVHCYAESSPWSTTNNVLTHDDYARLIREASALGCRSIQFIGGEPTLNKNLCDLIRLAKNESFEFIECYTNLTHLSEDLLSCYVENSVHIATSFYSLHEGVHDLITKVPGSYARTLRNIDLILRSGLYLRVGIIVMEENEGDIDATVQFMKERGIETVGTDRVRQFGRGSSDEGGAPMSELCGSCWKGSLCVAPDGKVSPCIMSKSWSVGSIVEHSLSEVAGSDSLYNLRMEMCREAATRSTGESFEAASCDPCEPRCNPRCSPNCSPCYPHGKCNPKLFG
jgi:MoaA/NifB/PqqE/SkfB family radical SAM enzyme